MPHTLKYKRKFGFSQWRASNAAPVLPLVHCCLQNKDAAVCSTRNAPTASSDWKEKVVQEKRGITCLLYNDTVYIHWRKKNWSAVFFLSPEVKECRNPLSIKVSSLAFQTAPKAAATEKHRLEDDQNISCPPGKESVKVLRPCLESWDHILPFL